ncbi:hypothetical protein [Atopomonas sediminilitoris]|uniref:hypothetical protein n=1 Tax=Atopomonas sediminilitoris TaxID=2919919 RepID=UPI001F4EA994|nr:hypothetical protein [Atopomonas sediminilitoris]MCJ8168369.1 hypothetical protein [Atopomonas sediminilitoris]
MTDSKLVSLTALMGAADDAIEQVEYAHHQSQRLAALMGAILTTINHGPTAIEARLMRITDLVGLAQYLAEDLANYTSSQAEELRTTLNALEV